MAGTSESAKRAWVTMKSPGWKRRKAALRAWETMRSPEWRRHNAAVKAARTRKTNAGAQ